MKVAAELPLRILTHNIRYATSSPFEGERPWAERKQLLLNELHYNTRHQDAFICLQEVLHNQLVDIHTGLNSSPHPSSANPTWEYIGVGRDDGREAGEYSPIFYQPSVWQLQHWETVWLSETPDVPSKSWDAASIRIVTVAVFTHRASSRMVLALNTHLDDQGSRSRFEAAHIILAKIEEYRTKILSGSSTISGVFLAGDFNSQEHQEAYAVLTAPESPLADAAKLVTPTEHYGHSFTWTGFGHEGQDPTRIDYILLESAADKVFSHGRQPWFIEGYAVLDNRFEDGVFNSDHRAVVVDVLLGE
ncbi:endonuclease/exonuclease/phosphatase family protein [Aspergillus saccharolyticus JOP 1030-1]|uniref:Endonuclease/exonuclease/phosphatase domain-containing protein n=1 Tax=Aspergillus saccharolyticus JOP 1030-1 TaxID=1450539 RepID=A0A318Z2P5_9EURO|nr:hypothetical protein BP01DRAFT_305429 [Aspergillus saccharolyticus JOP 1030-1]PYH41555.1 hypothetical protein BP01DRAFT_305429 [Aspergillus saccharolyticus JOP 1030-1]